MAFRIPSIQKITTSVVLPLPADYGETHEVEIDVVWHVKDTATLDKYAANLSAVFKGEEAEMTIPEILSDVIFDIPGLEDEDGTTLIYSKEVLTEKLLPHSYMRTGLSRGLLALIHNNKDEMKKGRAKNSSSLADTGDDSKLVA